MGFQDQGRITLAFKETPKMRPCCALQITLGLLLEVISGFNGQIYSQLLAGKAGILINIIGLIHVFFHG
jgi:hypothetical protein